MGLELKSLSRADVLGAMSKQLGVMDIGSSEDGLTVALVAAAIRRIAASICPCPRETIIGTAVEAFAGLDNADSIRARVRDALDRLVVIGDLLELSGTSTLPSAAADGWLYCAPPTFVFIAPLIVVLGVEAEDRATLPFSLRQQVRCKRELRILEIEDVEVAKRQLLDAGYREISKAAWSRLPQERPARKFLDEVIKRLEEAGGEGRLEGLRVLGAANSSENYAARWITPDRQSGHFVGRRPQAFGSDLWVFVELEHGRPVRFLDLPWRGGKFRGCDHGWRVQSALDACSGKPQSYRVAREGDSFRYEFFSPIPLWAERRLRVHGERVAATGVLIAYELEQQARSEIDGLLKSYMWFQQITQAK